MVAAEEAQRLQMEEVRVLGSSSVGFNPTQAAPQTLPQYYDTQQAQQQQQQQQQYAGQSSGNWVSSSQPVSTPIFGWAPGSDQAQQQPQQQMTAQGQGPAGFIGGVGFSFSPPNDTSFIFGQISGGQH